MSYKRSPKNVIVMSFENSITILFASVKNQCFNLTGSTLVGVTF